MDAFSNPNNGNGLGVVPTIVVTVPDGAIGQVLQSVLSGTWSSGRRCGSSVQRRLVREPLAIARLLAERYPDTPGMAYIPSVAWVHTLRLATSRSRPGVNSQGVARSGSMGER